MKITHLTYCTVSQPSVAWVVDVGEWCHHFLAAKPTNRHWEMNECAFGLNLFNIKAYHSTAHQQIIMSSSLTLSRLNLKENSCHCHWDVMELKLPSPSSHSYCMTSACCMAELLSVCLCRAGWVMMALQEFSHCLLPWLNTGHWAIVLTLENPL